MICRSKYNITKEGRGQFCVKRSCKRIVRRASIPYPQRNTLNELATGISRPEAVAFSAPSVDTLPTIFPLRFPNSQLFESMKN